MKSQDFVFDMDIFGNLLRKHFKFHLSIVHNVTHSFWFEDKMCNLCCPVIKCGILS